MPISPIGGIHFANQNAPVHSAQASNELAKDSFATLVNMSEFQAKEKAVEKLEKVNQTHEVSDEVKERQEEEKKHSKHHQEQEQEQEQEDEQEEQEVVKKSSHLLDLSI
ncbi:hypothetical protein [Campylobacter lari]|uniref:hypothetical protein n=1 Tax=Campylobacter lari TaxID=201 RepID=UPI00057C68F9|nr:hypothetical protein [Campylobacter lari]AJD07019.1 hypothetical protein UPTC16712_1538 [Campylobacter lari RM16712]MCR6511095.1 hypothetical protein [Campylobacter lari]MCR6527760.1 hypothetical protein [Campylobacter lari]MCR6541710.1 hypothetical protein [Campylobacter lari]MCR6557428.1 hypothetical protein [Campylobacter lari]